MGEAVQAWQVQGMRFASLLSRAVPLADSLEDAIEAVDAAMAMEDTGHIPATYRPTDAAFGHDIFNKQAQRVLDRAMKAVRSLSAAARRELKEILKTDHPGVLARSIVQFVDRYRNQLTQILGRTNLASLLEGARQVASKMPPIALPGLAGPPPASLGPEAAAGLLRKLQGMPEEERERELYELPAEQQAYAREALAVGGMEPPLPPVALPAPPAGSPDELHFPIIEEAVKDLSERNVVNRFEYDRLEEAARRKAFTVANVQARETLTKIRDALAENVAEGADLETFREKVLASVGEGTFLSEPHLEVVWRTNVQTAFSDGQMAVLNHPVVRDGYPYTAYDAIHDDRVRENHLALEKLGIDGTNVYRIDDPVFQTFRPPWDYNDRCSWTPMTVRQAAEKGIPEAAEWLRTGNEPTQPAFVPMPPFRPPPGFDRSLAGAPLSILLSLEPCGASFALDERGDWHGPNPPGEGWVQVGQGPQGGMIWRKQGGQAPQQPSTQTVSAQTPAKPPGHADASFQVAKQNLARVISQATDRKAIAQEVKSQAEWLRDTLGRAIEGALDEATVGIPPAAAKSVRSKALRVARDAAKDFRDDVSNMASQYKRQDFLAELPNLTLDLGTPLGDFEAEIHSELKDYAFDRGTRRLSDAELNDRNVIDRVDAEAEAWAKDAAAKARSALQAALGGGREEPRPATDPNVRAKAAYERLYGAGPPPKNAKERAALEREYKSALEEAKGHSKGGAKPSAAPSPQPSSVQPVSPEAGVMHVLTAVGEHGGENNLASMVDVRRRLAELGVTDRAVQDAAINEARRRGLVTATNFEGRSYLPTKEELDALLYDEGSGMQKGHLALRPDLHARRLSASFGMVGDEWHGPEPPGPGWVEVGTGPKGGKVWKRQGGQTQQQPVQKPVQRSQQTQQPPSKKQRAMAAVASLEQQGVKLDGPLRAAAVEIFKSKAGSYGHEVKDSPSGGKVFSFYDDSDKPDEAHGGRGKKQYVTETDAEGHETRFSKVTYRGDGTIFVVKHDRPPPPHWEPPNPVW